MLNSMREGSGAHLIKIIALGFVMLGVGGMVFMDVGGVFRGGLNDTTLATIGRTKIDLQTFERTALPIVRAQNMSMQEAQRFGLLNNILNQMIARETIRQEAIDQGLLISREQIAQYVADLIKTQVQDGETQQQALERLLTTQGISEAELIQSMRQNLTMSLIEKPLNAASAYTPKLAASAFSRYQAESRDVMFFSVDKNAIKQKITPDDDTLKAYYDTLKDQYQVPEERTFKAVYLSSDDLRKNITITDADLRAAYDARKDSFMRPESRRIEQLVFQDADKAKNAAKRAKAGAKLESLAGTDAGYRPAINVEQVALPEDMAAPVFAAKKGEILAPINTALGWHLIHVIDITPASQQSFNVIKADLRREMESDAIHDEMDALITKLDDALANGDSIDQLADTLGQSPITIGPINLAGDITDQKNAPALLTTLAKNKDALSSVFELMEGETGDLTEVADGLYAVFALDKVRMAHDRPFAEVKKDIQAKWVQTQTKQALNKLVDDLTTAINTKQKTFKQAAKDIGAKVRTVRDIKRDSKIAGIDDPIARGRLFMETNFDQLLQIPAGNKVILAKVLSAKVPTTHKAEATDLAKDFWHQQMQQGMTAAFIADLRNKMHVKTNEDLLAKRYGEK